MMAKIIESNEKKVKNADELIDFYNLVYGKGK